jgi:hypothetical protein
MGLHDSTANFCRFQATGFHDFTLISTGTWLVTLSELSVSKTQHNDDVTSHISATGTSLSSVRAIDGQEFDMVSDHYRGTIDAAAINRVLQDQTMAVRSSAPATGWCAARRAREGS